MLRVWLGVAILATSWLFGLGYYHEANLALWALAVAVGTACLLGRLRPSADRAVCAVGAVLVCPATVVSDWPFRAIFLLLFVGLVLITLPIPRRWPKFAGSAALMAGVILLAQGLALLAYRSGTARSHDLPQPLAFGLTAILRLMGIDASPAGNDLALHSMRQVHPLAATWELLLGPVTLGFLVGGITMLWVLSRGRSHETGRAWFLRSVVRLALVTLAWLPIRASLLIALYMHRALRVEYEAPLALLDQFWSPWLHLALLAGPVLLAWRFVRHSREQAAATAVVSPHRGRLWASGVFACGAVALLTAGVLWNPVGERQRGRVAVDEHHSSWEPTGRPFDTEWYGNESGYNYACIYDYCSRFYDMSRITQPLTPEVLRDVDVLILKVPNLAPYGPAEIEAVCAFVERGGGLLLMGEHTDVFKTGTHLNDVARRFGFRFRYDCLFGIDSFFEQVYEPPLVPHPIVQHFPRLDFAVSCSIDPGRSPGRAAIIGTGLKNLGADYHASNFYPQAVDQPEMRYGAFVQLWTTSAGRGRVAAFTDSTQFSNFCVFDPGKSELFVGMVEWLSHRGSIDGPRPILLLGGALLLAVSGLFARGSANAWIIVLTVGALGWAGTAHACRLAHQKQMPFPQAVRPMVNVIFDRTVSSAGLPKNGFTAGKEDEYGIFERWALRLGYFNKRAAGQDAFSGDLLVVLCPSGSVSPEYRQGLEAYVETGGKVLMVDAMGNTGSTANSLLYSFGLKIDRSRPVSGTVKFSDGWPSVPVDTACRISGGEVIARIDDVPVGATVRRGRGSVTVLTFGSRFSDFNMGVTGDVIPDPELRKVYDVEFGLLRWIVEQGAVTQPASAPATQLAGD